MRKCVLFLSIVLVCFMANAKVQQSEISFATTVHDFGSFSETDPVVTCKFIFTNTGNGPLVINQAIASCGCTVPSFTQKPVMPGEKGEVSVTYNGKRRSPGHFKKIITIKSNAKTSMVRLYIEGEMTSSTK